MLKRILLLAILFTLIGSGLVLALEKGDTISEIDLISMEGTEINFSSLLKESEFILFDIWATWCQPCVLAMRDYQRNLEFFREHNIEIIAVSAGDSPTAVRDFIVKHGITFSVFIDKNMKTLSSWGVKGIPTAFLVDKDGMIIMKSVGYINFSHFALLIKNALAKSESVNN